MVEQEDSSFLPIPKLKSIVAVFVGLFCILCFKKLIAFGSRWKNIIIDWGYRSLNVPSLWSSDAFVEGSTLNGSSSTSPSSTRLQSGTLSMRVPALRLPDAWPNFLLTWLYLNFQTMSNLTPTWVAAINEELIRLCTQSHANREKCHAPGSKQLELNVIQKSSVPPRLSAIETSASGSTRELHFHCTFSSPQVFAQVTVIDQQTSTDNSHSPSSQSYLVHMQQISCRVQIICVALEGDYMLLSWKLVSPLLVQRLSLLTLDNKPVSELGASETRWIKDMLYLGVQSAVVRVVLNPFHLTPVQQSLPTESLQGAKLAMQLLRHRKAQVSTVDSTTSRTSTGNAIHLHVTYAILLEPSELGPMDPLLHVPLRCEVHCNPGWLSSSVEHSSAVGSKESLLLSTDGVYLKHKQGDTSRPGKTFLNGKLQTAASTSYVAVWNQDSVVPLSALTSDMLDVVLCTGTAPSLSQSVHFYGHAVLPLPTYNQSPSNFQHVLLIDCYTGEPLKQWTPRTELSGDVRAKFMLMLHANLVSSGDAEEKQSLQDNLTTMSSPVQLEPRFLQNSSAPSPDVSNRRPIVGSQLPQDHQILSHSGMSHSSDPSQTSLFLTADSSSASKSAGKRQMFLRKLFRTSRKHAPKTTRSEEFGHVEFHPRPNRRFGDTVNEPTEFLPEDHDREDRSKLRRFFQRHSFRIKRRSNSPVTRHKSFQDSPIKF